MDFIDKLTLEEIEKIEFIDEKELEKLSFVELGLYLETLNKIKKRYEELQG